MARDPVKQRERAKRYRDKNRIRRAAQAKSWREANPERRRDYGMTYRSRNREQAKLTNRSWRLENKYGLTQEQYVQMHVSQGGTCAICHRPPTDKRGKLVIDHCHATGHVRALLCSNCNVAIGMMGDNADRLHAAGAYLDQFNEY